ncbi:hypothetical protein [Aeromonas popoffii]|uniref:hypothetical protein n=1 Tax=Aeromonas popoffii TaxID=70856 RepID=UPI0012EE163D|nr:hypothetical protein [Aeromonas popoffii]
MRIELAWWSLAESDPQPPQLRARLDESVHREWHGVKNLAMKLWLESIQPPRWGALTIWEGEKPAVATLPVNLSAKWIGRPADQYFSFEATVCMRGQLTEAWLGSLMEQIEMSLGNNIPAATS